MKSGSTETLHVIFCEHVPLSLRVRERHEIARTEIQSYFRRLAKTQCAIRVGLGRLHHSLTVASKLHKNHKLQGVVPRIDLLVLRQHDTLHSEATLLCCRQTARTLKFPTNTMEIGLRSRKCCREDFAELLDDTGF